MKFIYLRFSKRFIHIFLLLFVVLDIALVGILLFHRLQPQKVSAEELDRVGSKIVQLCDNKSGKGGWRDCYGKEMAAFTKQHDFTDVMRLLAVVQKKDQKTRDCHILAHRSVAEEVAKNPANWSDVLDAIRPDMCNYGFIHGIVEARSRFDNTFVLNEKTIPAFCDEVVRKKNMQSLDQTCAHIMGHVLLAEEKGDIKAVVAMCDKLPINLQYQCYGGTFMENFTRDNLVAHEVAEYIPWSWENTLLQENICNEYSDLTAKGCWMEISHMYNNQFMYQPEKIFELCSRAPEESFRDECYLHGTATLIQQDSPADSYLTSLCKPYEDNNRLYPRCVNGIVTGLLYSSSGFSDRAAQMCSITLDKYKEECFRQMGRVLSRVTSQAEVQKACATVPSPFTSVCSCPTCALKKEEKNS